MPAGVNSVARIAISVKVLVQRHWLPVLAVSRVVHADESPRIAVAGEGVGEAGLGVAAAVTGQPFGLGRDGAQKSGEGVEVEGLWGRRLRAFDGPGGFQQRARGAP